MNYSTAVFLINKNVRAMLCTYEADEPNKKASRRMFKTLDPALKVGDYVIVPTDTRHKMTVNRVVEADVDVDFDSGTVVDWIVGRVDTVDYDQLLAQESQAISMIRKGEAQKKRESLRDSILAGQTEELKALPISAMNGDSAAPKI